MSLADDVPDHSSLSRIRDRYGEEVFETVFRHIITLCQQKGLVGQACRVMTDATLIAADTSLDSLVHNDPAKARQETEAGQSGKGLMDSSATALACELSTLAGSQLLMDWRTGSEMV